MIASASMSSATTTFTSQPDVVADRVLRRAELGKMASRLQNRLALAQFKTRHGWEDLTLDMIEPKVEDEIRRKRSDGDMLSDSSSSTSEHPYSAGRTLMSSPLKPPIFSDAIGSSSGSSGHRKRTYVASFDDLNNDPYNNNNNTYQIHGSGGRRVTYMMSSPSKRYRSSPPPSRHASGPLLSHQPQSSHGHSQRSASYMPAPPPQQPTFSGHAAWKDNHHLSHSSPIKPKRHQHFTTAAGPDVSLFHGARRIADVLTNTNFVAPQSDEDDDELLPTHSFRTSSMSFGPSVPSASGMPAGLASSASLSGSLHATRSGSPPSTPPMRPRGLANGNGNGAGGRRKKKSANITAEHDMMMGNDSEGSHTGLGIDQVEGRDTNTSNVLASEHNGNGKSGVEGADLLLFLAASPSPANPSGRPLLGGSSSSRMDPPSTPPSKFNNLALPSSMMTTPGGGSMFPQTPGQAFDFADFVNITPSPAQKPWKTPNLLGSKTPVSVTRRRLTFDDM